MSRRRYRRNLDRLRRQALHLDRLARQGRLEPPELPLDDVVRVWDSGWEPIDAPWPALPVLPPDAQPAGRRAWRSPPAPAPAARRKPAQPGTDRRRIRPLGAEG